MLLQLTCFYFTLDSNFTFQNYTNPNELIGSYCFSKNRYTCEENRVPDFDLKTGYKCSTTDRINPINISYCTSYDK